MSADGKTDGARVLWCLEAVCLREHPGTWVERKPRQAPSTVSGAVVDPCYWAAAVGEILESDEA